MNDCGTLAGVGLRKGKIKVLLVDDHPILRKGLGQLINAGFHANYRAEIAIPILGLVLLVVAWQVYRLGRWLIRRREALLPEA